MPQRSIVFRFAISLVANTLRSGISIVSGLIIARSLGPSEYGSFAFLLSTVIVLRQLLDMGCSTAFFTLISQKPRGSQFFGLYAAWQFAQLVIPLLVVAALLPNQTIQFIWLGHDREVVLLALLASFMQQQLWFTVTQIGESRRQTRHVQLVGVGVAVAHLIFVVALYVSGWMSQVLLFTLLAVEYFFASVLLFYVIGKPNDPYSTEPDLRTICAEYWTYCRPLFLSAWAGFAYGFADTWILQRFGGASEQAYFAVSNQLSMVSLLATNSLLQIFWKETAEYYQRGEMERARAFFGKATRFLLLIGASTSCFLIPWSREIMVVLLGESYSAGWPVLALMLFFPVHTVLAQVVGTTYFAMNKTRPHANIVVVSMLLSIPLTYLLIAPNDSTHFGFDLGSPGLAIKLIVMQIVTVNVLWWWFCRSLQWKYDWSIQLAIPGICLGVSLALHVPVRLIWNGALSDGILMFGGTLILFLCAMLGIVWRWPQVVGWHRVEFQQLLDRMLARVSS